MLTKYLNFIFLECEITAGVFVCLGVFIIHKCFSCLYNESFNHLSDHK